MTSSAPLPISVVIPAYNAARTLARCVKSARAQTRGAAEIIVVDDGSSDDTARVARDLGTVVLEQCNAGCGPARNTGMRAACQPWIAFLDADDEWLPEKLEAQWRAIQLRPHVGIVFTDVTYVSADGTAAHSMLLNNPPYRRLTRTPLGDDVFFIDRMDAARAMVAANFMQPTTVLVRRDLVMGGNFFLAKADLLRTPICSEAEDAEWYLRLLRRSDVLAVERLLATYHVQNTSNSLNPGRMRCGDIALGRRVLKNPTLYPAGLEPDIVAVRPLKRREAVSVFLRRGQTSFARTVLAEAFEERRSAGNALRLAFVTVLDNGLARSMLEALRVIWRFLKRSFGRKLSGRP